MLEGKMGFTAREEKIMNTIQHREKRKFMIFDRTRFKSPLREFICTFGCFILCFVLAVIILGHFEKLGPSFVAVLLSGFLFYVDGKAVERERIIYKLLSVSKNRK